MTKAEFWGCALLAFGPPAALYMVAIAPDPVRVILMMASCFFWLLSLLISGLMWFAVVPLRDELAFGLFFSVLFQECFRVLLYLLLKKAERGLEQVTDGSAVLASTHKHARAFVCGFGFGIMSGAFALINLLRDMAGPGTVGIHGDSPIFFLTSSAQTICMVLLHTAWGVILFDGLEERRYTFPVGVLMAHALVSGITLLNYHDPPLHVVTLLVSYATLLASGLIAFWISGGKLRQFCHVLTHLDVKGMMRIPKAAALSDSVCHLPPHSPSAHRSQRGEAQRYSIQSADTASPPPSTVTIAEEQTSSAVVV